MQGTDFAPGTQIKPTIVHITFDASGNVNQIGVGFEVFLPSAVGTPGAAPMIADAYSWTPGPAVAARINTVMGNLLADLATHAGLPVNHALGRAAGATVVPAIPTTAPPAVPGP